MDKEVGERIRHVRLDKGYTRDTLSMMSGVSEKYIFQIERQHTGFSVDILLKLTKALDSSCDYLLRGHTEFPYENEIIELIEKFEPKVWLSSPTMHGDLMLSSLYEIMKRGDL